MIKKIELTNFKRFRNETIEVHPYALSLLVGGNNSGKSSLLHALALWQFCRTVLQYEKGDNALRVGHSGSGYGITFDDFTPLNIPSFKYLWTSLKATGGYSLHIKLFWDNDAKNERFIKFSLSLTQEILYIKASESNVPVNEKIPNIAYLPTFAGIVNKEQWFLPSQRNRLIGQGLAGSCLRNQILDLQRANQELRLKKKGNGTKIKKKDLEEIRANDPYELLQQVLIRTFRGVIYPKRFNPDFHTNILVNFRKGEYKTGRFIPFKDYRERDIMVEGSGFLQWLSVYTFALSPNIDTLLLDEPDAHLHCSLQNTLIDELMNICIKKQKQILIATHSSEVIKTFDFSDILYFDGPNIAYMKCDDNKVKALSSLGLEYFPLLEKIQANKKVLFVENDSDALFLKVFCNKYSRWPKDIVVWSKANKPSERKALFLYLKEQIRGLKCISIVDRDNELYNQTSKSLKDKRFPDINEGDSFLLHRLWRRWEIESYLLCPDAISRLVNRKNPAKSLDVCKIDVDRFLAENSGIVVNPTYLKSEKVPSNQALFDNDAKFLLYPLLAKFDITKFEIAEEMTKDEIFEDIITLIDEIVRTF